MIRPELRARLNALEVRDEGVSAEHEDGYTRRQTVQAIGQVRRIRPRRHNEIRPDQIQDDTHAEPRKAQRQSCGARKGNLECSGVFAELVRHDEGAQREERCNGNLTDDLARRMQTERTLAHNLDAVIEQADNAEPHEEEHEEQARPGRSRTGNQRTNQPGDDGRQDDDETAHGGRAALGQVLVGPSWRMNWPYWCNTRKRMSSGVHITDSAMAMMNAEISPITGSFPSLAGYLRPATNVTRRSL